MHTNTLWAASKESKTFTKLKRLRSYSWGLALPHCSHNIPVTIGLHLWQVATNRSPVVSAVCCCSCSPVLLCCVKDTSSHQFVWSLADNCCLHTYLHNWLLLYTARCVITTRLFLRSTTVCSEQAKFTDGGQRSNLLFIWLRHWKTTKKKTKKQTW